MLSVQTLPRASGSHLAGTHRYRADANKRKQDVKHVTKLGTTCVFRPEKTHQVSLFLTYFKKIPYHQTTYKPTATGDNSIYFSEEQPFPFFCPLLTPPPLITPCHVDSPLTLPWEKDTFRKLFFLLGDQKLTGPIFRQHISVHHCAWHRQSCT